MRPALLLLPAVLLFACGGSEPPAASPAAPGTAAAPAAEEPCLASMSGEKPSVPVEEVGMVTVHLGKDGCSIEARGRDGATKTPVPCENPRQAREAARNAACALGGDKLWPKDKAAAEAGGLIELVVGRYTKPDAKADLELICTPFAKLTNPATGASFDPTGLDPSQRATLRAALLQEKLTSRQWRLWLHGFRDSREVSIATLRDAAKAAHLACDIEWTGAP